MVSRKLAATIHIHHRYCYYYLNHKLICILRPTEGGRLSRPRQCSKGAQSVPKAVYRRSRYAAATAADGYVGIVTQSRHQHRYPSVQYFSAYSRRGRSATLTTVANDVIRPAAAAATRTSIHALWRAAVALNVNNDGRLLQQPATRPAARIPVKTPPPCHNGPVKLKRPMTLSTSFNKLLQY